MPAESGGDGRARREDRLDGAFRRHLLRTHLIPPGSSVLAAVSGGLDSVVLLDLLRTQVAAGIVDRITAAHFDHRMRSGSAADAAWVRGLCRAWDVPFHLGVAEPMPRTEEEARDARYAFLFATAEAIGASRIAVAHHADDQAETVLFRLARGTGLGGLAGIPARRGHVVRPLLPFRRSRLEAHAAARGLRHREDPTNVDPRFARNRIRLAVLPALEATRPGATEAIVDLAREAAHAEAGWNWMADEILEALLIRAPDGSLQLARDGLLGYHPYIRARLLRRAFGRLGRVPGRAGTRAALAFITSGASGGAVELSGGLRLERHFDRLIIRRPGAPGERDSPLIIAAPGAGRGQAVIGGRRVRAEWTLEPGSAGVAFDAEAIRFPIELRGWRPGDRIRLASGTKKLKKLFVEKRVPRPRRRQCPVLAEENGFVLWVEGLGRAAGSEPVPANPAFRIRLADGTGT
jgi:tRNA(Ile)-lysidine synthase